MLQYWNSQPKLPPPNEPSPKRPSPTDAQGTPYKSRPSAASPPTIRPVVHLPTDNVLRPPPPKAIVSSSPPTEAPSDDSRLRNLVIHATPVYHSYVNQDGVPTRVLQTSVRTRNNPADTAAVTGEPLLSIHSHKLRRHDHITQVSGDVNLATYQEGIIPCMRWDWGPGETQSTYSIRMRMMADEMRIELNLDRGRGRFPFIQGSFFQDECFVIAILWRNKNVQYYRAGTCYCSIPQEYKEWVHQPRYSRMASRNRPQVAFQTTFRANAPQAMHSLPSGRSRGESRSAYSTRIGRAAETRMTDIRVARREQQWTDHLRAIQHPAFTSMPAGYQNNHIRSQMGRQRQRERRAQRRQIHREGQAAREDRDIAWQRNHIRTESEWDQNGISRIHQTSVDGNVLYYRQGTCYCSSPIHALSGSSGTASSSLAWTRVTAQAINAAEAASHDNNTVVCPACGDEGNPDSLSHLCLKCSIGHRSFPPDPSSSTLTVTAPPGLTLQESTELFMITSVAEPQLREEQNIKTVSVMGVRQCRGFGLILADRLYKCRPFQPWDEVEKVRGSGRTKISHFKKAFTFRPITKLQPVNRSILEFHKEKIMNRAYLESSDHLIMMERMRLNQPSLYHHYMINNDANIVLDNDASPSSIDVPDGPDGHFGPNRWMAAPIDQVWWWVYEKPGESECNGDSESDTVATDQSTLRGYRRKAEVIEDRELWADPPPKPWKPWTPPGCQPVQYCLIPQQQQQGMQWGKCTTVCSADPEPIDVPEVTQADAYDVMVAAMFPDRDTDGDPPPQPARFLPGRLHVHHGPYSSSQDHGYLTPEVPMLHGQTIQD